MSENPIRLRYDPEENISRHAATHKKCCYDMEQKYGWELIRIEAIPDNPIFKVDCVFEGFTEFTSSFQEGKENA